MYGPANTWARLGAASSPEGGEIDDFSDIFDIRHWVDNEAVQIGSLSVTPKLVCHPTESYGLRITDSSGALLVYSGDTGYCDAADRLGPRRRRIPVRGVVDAFVGAAAQVASVLVAQLKPLLKGRRRPCSAWLSCVLLPPNTASSSPIAPPESPCASPRITTASSRPGTMKLASP